MMDSEDEKRPLLESEQDSKSYAEEKKPLIKKKEETKKSASLAQLFRTATCLDVFLMVAGSLFAMVHGAGWPVLFIFFGDMTDTFVTVSGNLTSNDTLLEDFNNKMTEYSIYYMYVGAAVFVSSYFQVVCWATACQRQAHRMRLQFFSAILRQEIGWFDVHQSGELTARLADDLERVKDGIGDKFSYAIQFFSQFVAGFVIGFTYGWKMALVMMSLTPVLVLAGAFMAKLMASYSTREQAVYANAGSVAEEVLSCIRTVTSFNGQHQDIKRYKEKLEESKAIGIKKSWISGLGIGFTFLAMFSAYALAFWYGTEQVKDWYNSGFADGLSPGTVLTVFFCVLVGTFSIGNITPHVTSVAAAKGAAAVLIDIIDNKPSIDSSSPGGRKFQNVQGNIVFQHVDFTYPTREEVQILKKFTMTVKPGQTVALVGPSGCGKSTVINLIQRFYDPDQGTVSVDGVDIKEFNIKTLRDNIGVVSQEPILFGMSIEDNILLGNPDATNEQITEAAKAANCHDFISKLPKAYKTLVGERGAQLSGGQKQRVAIARALIRNPKILLLDEATSALDTQSERIVQAALDKAREGRTTIVIAHRLSTIQNADVIYVVKDGAIVEMGKHSDLMAMNGEYHQLVTVQMLVENENSKTEPDDEVMDTIDEMNGPKEQNGIPRKRTISDSKAEHKINRQISKPQMSSQDSKKAEVKDEEKETAEKAKFCPMLRENKPEWPFIVIGCCAACINGCTMPAFAMFFGEMIKVFQSQGQNSLLWSMMFLVLGGVQFLTNTIQTVSFGHSGEKMTMRLRLKTFTAMLRQDIGYFDDPRRSTGALTMRLATDATMVKTATGIRIATMLQALFGVIAALVIAFIYGWQLALVVLGGVPLMAIAGALQLKTVMGNQKRDSTEMELAGKTASEAIENIRTVQSLAREPYFYKKYRDFLLTPHRTNMKLAHLTGFTYGFSQGIVFMIYAGAFRFGAYMVSEGEMNSSDVFKVFFAISLTGLVVGQVSSFLPDYSKAAFSAGIIFKVLDTVPMIDVYSKQGSYPSKLAGSIEFKGVHFNYPTRPDVPVLKGINIRVEPGQTVALVGPSGCGKSTVVSLIQRFYDPSSGSIEVDGQDIRDINLVRLRHLISVVSQEPILFDCSIKDNITYGLDSPKGMDEIIGVARAANIHDFISNLPMGYDTVVGEKGTQLSGGQKQRVAIARALIRNPQILLLDEATSALDTESEQQVQAALDNAQEGRTCIVIAHRLSTIQNADVIYVIDSGNIVEFGNHQQLLNKNGVYAQLVSGQKLSKT